MYQKSNSLTGVLFGLPAVLLFFCACNSTSAYEQQHKKLLATQQATLEFTRQQTTELNKAIENRLYDPQTAEKTRIWQPKAMQINAAAKSITSYIERLMAQAEKSTTDECISNQQVNDLYQQLYQYKKAILAADPEIKNLFANKVLKEFDSANDLTGKSIAYYFEHGSKNEALLMLQNTVQEVALAENKTVTFCFHQTTAYSCGLDYVQAMLTQNTTVLQTGEKLVIKAGIGAYTSRANPAISINGQPVSVNNAVGTYSVKIKQGKGKYSIPVHIEYINQDGLSKTMSTTIDYTVK
jgi:hypothetical protein